MPVVTHEGSGLCPCYSVHLRPQPRTEPAARVTTGSSQLLSVGDAGLSDRRVLGGTSSSPGASWDVVGACWPFRLPEAQGLTEAVRPRVVSALRARMVTVLMAPHPGPCSGCGWPSLRLCAYLLWGGSITPCLQKGN